MERRKPMPAAIGGDIIGDLGGRLEVVPLFDHFDAECSHGGIFLDAVACRNYDSGGNAKAASGEANRLAVIPSGGGDYSRRLGGVATKLVNINETAAHFKCTGGSMVLVLDPHRRADTRFEKGPPVLRRRRQRAVDQLRCRVEINQGR